jgi:hypothetical protein
MRAEAAARIQRTWRISRNNALDDNRLQVTSVDNQTCSPPCATICIETPAPKVLTGDTPETFVEGMTPGRILQTNAMYAMPGFLWARHTQHINSITVVQASWRSSSPEELLYLQTN